MALFASDNNKEFTVETRYLSPAHLLLKIESFSLLMDNRIHQFESKEFAAGDYKWRLMICPHKDKSENGDDHISVYLSIAGRSSLPMDWEVNAVFTVLLYNHILDNYLCFRGLLHGVREACMDEQHVAKDANTEHTASKHTASNKTSESHANSVLMHNSVGCTAGDIKPAGHLTYPQVLLGRSSTANV